MKWKTSRWDFGSDPRPSLQLYQRKYFRVIHHTAFENDLIPMTPNLSYHCNPHIP